MVCEPARSIAGFVISGKGGFVESAQVHAEGDFAEAEHAALGHHAVTSFVPASAEALLRAAMLDHDRDFAVFYNTLADMLE